MVQEIPASKTILVVEDDDIIREGIVFVLQNAGYQTLRAKDGQEALDHLRVGQPPNLIVLDMMLPGRSGFLVLEKIKAKKPRNTKPFVIMITGNQGARHKMYAESLGVSEYLNKPVKMDKLIATAERLLGAAPAAPAGQ